MTHPFDKQLLAPRYWGGWTLAGLALLLSHLPRPATRRIGFLVGRLISFLNTKRRRYVEVNLALCFPDRSDEERKAMLDDHFRIMGRILLDYPLLWRTRIDDLVEVEGHQYIADARASGKSVILLTGHGLSLDITGIALARHIPIVAFVKPARFPVTDHLMRLARSRCQSVLYRRSEGLRPVLRGMAEGRVFYYLPDEDHKHEKQVFVSFFGVQKATLPTLGRLARIADALVLPGMGYWLPDTDRYLVKIRPPLADFPTGDDTVDAERMNAVLEGMVREHPEQYMWTFRFFRTRPPGEESPYS